MQHSLVEVFDDSFCRLQIFEGISTITGKKAVKAKGRFQMAETRNCNGRIYPKALLEREILKLQPQVKSRSLFGELDHPTIVATSLQNASHVITELYMSGNEVIGEYEVLGTTKGNDLRAILEAGCKPGISSRGAGSLIKEGDELKVAHDFKLVSFDAVADPSTYGAYPTIAEGQLITLEQAVLLESVSERKSRFIEMFQRDNKFVRSLTEAFRKCGIPTSHIREMVEGDEDAVNVVMKQLASRSWMKAAPLQETYVRAYLKEMFRSLGLKDLQKVYENITNTDEILETTLLRKLAGIR